MSFDKKFIKLLFACLLLFFFNNPQIHSQSDSTLVSKTNRYVLFNGMTLVFKENHAVPFVCVQAWIKAGSANEENYTGSGISHFVEHMLFKGTPDYGVGEIEREIKKLGGDISASTSFDYINCKIAVPKQNLKQVLLIAADILFNAAFSPDEYQKEKNVILSEMRLYNDEPQRRLGDLLYSNAYTNHPYRYPIIGQKERFESLTNEDLIEFYKRKFTPDNIILAIGGDSDFDSVVKLAEEIFSKIPPQKIYQNAGISEPAQLGRREVTERYDTKPALLSMAFRSVSISDKDLYALDLLALILGDGDNSRLNKAIKQKQKLVYSITSYNYTPKSAGLFLISASLEEPSLERTINAIKKEIDIIKKNPPRITELNMARKRLRMKILLGLQTLDEQTQDIGANELLTGNPDFTDTYLENIEKVNARDIQRVAKQYLADDNLTVATLLPKTDNSQPIKTQVPKNISPAQKHILKNGIRVLLREDHTLPLVSVRASFCGGVRFEDEKRQGISNLIAKVLLKGTKSKSAQDMARIIDGLGGEVYAESGNNSFSIVMNLQTQDLDKGLLLLRELLTAPSFPQDRLQQEKEVIISQIRTQEKDIFYASEKLLRKTLYLKYPFRFMQLGGEESINRITRKEIKKFHKNFCNPTNMVLAIYGDISPEDVLKKLSAFGSLVAGISIAPILEDEQQPAAPREANVFLEKEQALLMVGFLGTKIDSPQRYPFEVLTSILSCGGGRIYNEIREDLGLAYTLGSYQVLGLERGYYVFYVATRPDNVGVAKDKLLAIINSLREKAPDTQEINSAKVSLISAHQLRLEANAQFAAETALDELYGLGYDNYKSYENKINAVTAEDLLRIAKEYFDLNSSVTIITLPQSQ